jgi:hypothetical protein
LFCCFRILIHFDVKVNVANELEAGIVAHGAEHEAENVAGEKGVAEELQRLQATRHVASFYVEKYGINEDKDSGGPEQNFPSMSNFFSNLNQEV